MHNFKKLSKHRHCRDTKHCFVDSLPYALCAPFEGVAALHPLGAPNYFTDKEKKDEKKRRAVRAAHPWM